MEPTPLRPQHNGRNYWIGIGIGFIPVLLLWGYGAFSCPITFSVTACSTAQAGSATMGLASTLLTLSVIAYLIGLVALVPLLIVKQARFVGYGVLTMVLVGPVVGVIGCTVLSGAALPSYASDLRMVVAGAT